MAAEVGRGANPPAPASLTIRVVWSPTALREVARIFDYLVRFNPAAARKVANALMVAGESLRSTPNRGRPVPNTTMRELITAYPYIIRDRVTPKEVRVLRVRHTSRRPTNP
jgi:plasmid stabilization system protein ParE